MRTGAVSIFLEGFEAVRALRRDDVRLRALLPGYGLDGPLDTKGRERHNFADSGPGPGGVTTV
jgi:hypothetical protein